MFELRNDRDGEKISGLLGTARTCLQSSRHAELELRSALESVCAYLTADMSSETSMSSDEAISTASEGGEQNTSCAEKPSTSSGSEHSEQFAERSLYCLALVNSETGDAVRPVTDEEAEELARALSTAENRTKPQANATSASATPTSRQNSMSRPKPGGPCNNCGVMGTCYFSSTHVTAPVSVAHVHRSALGGKLEGTRHFTHFYLR